MSRHLTTPSQFATEDFEPSDEILPMLQDDAKVLVVGAGGLGCEILKDLALSGIKNIHVIDLDKIDLTNLNRQFLFRMKDVNEYKAKVAAEFVMKRCPGVNITYSTEPVQNNPPEFFSDFSIIIAGLDNVDARRWINSTVHEIVENDEDGTPMPMTFLIDGGTEGFQGQARVIIPFETSCYECSMASLPPETTYPLCTIKETPRLPEHCIQYVQLLEWDKHFDRPMDKDSPDDMNWVFERAKARAAEYGIEGVTYKLTMGVTKNIIPAVASTNALISAACVNEAWKLLSGSNKRMDNYQMVLGQPLVSISTFPYEKRADCVVCCKQSKICEVSKDDKLSDWKEKIMEELRLKKPTMKGEKDYLIGAGFFAAQCEHKLEKTFEQLLKDGDLVEDEELAMTDSSIPSVMLIKFKII